MKKFWNTKTRMSVDSISDRKLKKKHPFRPASSMIPFDKKTNFYTESFYKMNLKARK